VTALGDVVRNAGKHRTGDSWHAQRLAQKEKVCVPFVVLRRGCKAYSLPGNWMIPCQALGA
ncbi:MAG: hypothetical protein MN733_09875, partial [Nitrososphaera sp.]|nr:hypothetical protein [Nitrososphaera sp.]